MVVRLKKVNRHQYSLLLNFLEKNPCLLRSKLSHEFTAKKRNELWSTLAIILNNQGGCQKPARKWQKTLSDWKCSVKSKAAKIKNARDRTDAGIPPVESLSDLEERLLLLTRAETVNGLDVSESCISGVSVREKGVTTAVSEEESVEVVPNGEAMCLEVAAKNSESESENPDTRVRNMPTRSQTSKQLEIKQENVTELGDSQISEVSGLESICSTIKESCSSIIELMERQHKDKMLLRERELALQERKVTAYEKLVEAQIRNKFR